MSGKLSGTGHIRLRRRPILRVERFDDDFYRKYRRSSFITFAGAGTPGYDGTGFHAIVRNGQHGFRLNPGQYLITYPNGEQLPVDAWTIHTFFYPTPVREEARHGA